MLWEALSDVPLDVHESYVKEMFAPFWEQVPEQDRPKDLYSIDPHTAVAASAWTGRRTLAQQCEVVLSLAPAAMDGVAQLIAEREAGLGNSPPEPVEADTIETLKALHVALGELIRLAEKSAPLGQQLRKISGLAHSVFGIVGNAGRLTVGGLVPAAACIIPTLGTVAALEWITGLPIDGTGVAAVAGGLLAVGGHSQRGGENKAG